MSEFLKLVKPQGGTLIAERLAALGPYVDRLMETTDVICILIITDGMPGRSGDTMAERGSGLAAQLKGMSQSGQIRVCVRLCTDDTDVSEFWYGFDELCDSELAINVIDDFKSEKARVARYNPWIPYTHAVHACCETGLRGFDAINNRKCTVQERKFLEPLVGAVSTSYSPWWWVLLVVFMIGIEIYENMATIQSLVRYTSVLWV
jgi:hypothetical protein